MANVLGLALKITGDASGLRLDPAQRALQRLGDETDKVAAIFDRFTGDSEAAGRAQAEFERKSRELLNTLRDGGSATEFAANFERIAEAARAEAAALQEAARITESVRTPLERFGQSAGELASQLEAGRISQETYNRALEQSTRGFTDAELAASGLAAVDLERLQSLRASAAAEAERVAAQQRGAEITASLQTDEEKRAARLTDLENLLTVGAISEETYSRAVEKASGAQDAAARAEQERLRVRNEGQRITERFATTEERRADELRNLERLLKANAISQETYARASAEASGANEAAAQAERELANAVEAASRIINQNLTAQERYDQQVQELQGHLEAGRLSQDQFNRALERAQQGLGQTTQEARRTDTQLQSIARQVTTISRIQIARLLVDGFQAIGNVARQVTGQIQSLVNGVRQSLDEIDKLSLRTGINREALQGYGVAAELAGVSTDELGATFQRLAANIGRANPPAELTQGLQQLGLTVQELRALAPEQQFAVIAQRISELPTATQRAGAAFGVLGEQGVRLTSLLQQQGNAIEEVRQRAERLGIIVRDDQIANVTQLNDTFTLVSQTINGIIGQVSGNLAPLITTLAEEFLGFVEGFQGIEASGGTALADRITDSLLTGAEFLAGVFDTAVAQLGDFATTLATVGEVFATATSALTAASSAGRAVFELGQSVVSIATVGVGKVLEGLGNIPFLSDVGEFGKALSDTAFAELEKNADQFVEAVDNAAAAAGRTIVGESPADAAERGRGAGAQFVANFREQVTQARSPEFRVNTNIESTRDAFDDFFGGLIDQSSQVTDLMREFEAAVAAAQEDGALTGDEIARIEELQKRVNAAIQQELATRNESVAAAAKQAEADGKRIDSLLKTSDATAKIIDDIAAVEREVGRVQQQIAEAGVGEDGAAQSRLQQLQALQAQLDEQLQATAQGFDQGFAAAFDAVGQRFNGLAEQAAEFGEAGIAAAARLQEGIAAAQEQAASGILNREAFEQEIRRQEQLFEREIEQVQAVAEERQRVNEFVDKQFALARFGGDQQRLEAATRLADLEREIVRVQQEVQTARASGDQAAVNAGITRLGQLDQVAAKERDVASGRQQFEEQIAQQREQYLQQIAEQQKQAEEQQKKFAEERAKAVEAENQRQAQRLRELNTLGSGVIEGNDIRTAEGAALFLQLAANRQDPALIEARLQTKRLGEIRQEIRYIAESLQNLPLLQLGGGIG